MGSSTGASVVPEPVEPEPVVPVVADSSTFANQETQEEVQEIFETENIVRVEKGEDPTELSIGNYVVVGAFSVRANASKYVERLKEAGFEAQSGFSSNTGLNYVYVGKEIDIFKARETREKFRTINQFQFPDTWILRIE